MIPRFIFRAYRFQKKQYEALIKIVESGSATAVNLEQYLDYR